MESVLDMSILFDSDVLRCVRCPKVEWDTAMRSCEDLLKAGYAIGDMPWATTDTKDVPGSTPNAGGSNGELVQPPTQAIDPNASGSNGELVQSPTQAIDSKASGSNGDLVQPPIQPIDPNASASNAELVQPPTQPTGSSGSNGELVQPPTGPLEWRAVPPKVFSKVAHTPDLIAEDPSGLAQPSVQPVQPSPPGSPMALEPNPIAPFVQPLQPDIPISMAIEVDPLPASVQPAQPGSPKVPLDPILQLQTPAISNPTGEDRLEELRLAAFAVPQPNYGMKEPTGQRAITSKLWLCPSGIGPGYYVSVPVFEKAKLAKIAYSEAHQKEQERLTIMFTEDLLILVAPIPYKGYPACRHP